MTTTEFIELVAQMRMTQKNYFKTRSKYVLEQSKALERQVDVAIAQIAEARAKQTDLAIPTPRQLETRSNINNKSIALIALLNSDRNQILTGDVSKVRDLHSEIACLINDLDIYNLEGAN